MATTTLSVEQVAGMLNKAAEQFSGISTIISQDLSNIVDFGRAIDDAVGYDNFFNALPAQFNTIRFWSRPYVSFAPSVYKDPARFGAIRAVYRTKYLKATNDPAWDLKEGQSYDPFVVHKNEIETRFWSKRVNTMIEQTIVREQLETAFRSPDELMSFIGMLEMSRTNSHGRFFDSLIMTLFQSIIIQADSGDGNGNFNENQKVKLLTEYNAISGTTLTPGKALYNEGFIRYAIYRIGIIRDQMKLTTSLFNIKKRELQTPEEQQRVVMLSDFARAAGVYLHDAPNQFNTTNLNVPGGDVVPAWQGMGTSGSLEDRMQVYGTVEFDGEDSLGGKVSNVIAVVYDDWALGVTNYRHTVTSQYNPKGQYTNYFDKMYAGLFVSPDENYVVFQLA